MIVEKDLTLLFVSKTKLSSFVCHFCRPLRLVGVFSVNATGRSGG